MNLGHTCLFCKVLCMGFFGDNEHNTVTLTHSAHGKHAFLVQMKENLKSPRKITIKKVYLESLHKRLGHISTSSLIAVDNAKFWQDIELRVDLIKFCTSC